MKKLLFIFLLPFVCYGQMIKEDHIKEMAFNMEVTYRHYKADNDLYVIFLHGSGEKGPLDGSLLSLVEKNGYPKHAKNGFMFPFNIIAPQSAGEHRNLMKVFPAYIKLKFNARVIIVTGLSMGGYGTYDAWLTDKLNLIQAVAPVCGAGRPTLLKEYRSIPVWHFHGDLDPTVKWATAKYFIDQYNANSGGLPIKVTLYTGVYHNSWDRAYSVTPGQDELFQWIKEQFANAPKGCADCDIEAFRERVIESVRATQ